MKKRYIVRLTSDEREYLEDLIHRGRHAAEFRRRAQILLLVDESEFGPALSDAETARKMNVSRRGVEIVREHCVMQGLEQAVDRKKRIRERSRKLDGAGEAQLIQLACSDAPEGHARWTLRLLADRLVELEIVESISQECVRQALKKRPEAVAEGNVVYFQARRCGVRVPDGASTGCLSAAASS